MVYFCQNLEEYSNLKKKIGFKTLGLVPTMGNLHQGHLSLLDASLNENEASLVSIYVNPKQFSESEDYDEYPRTLEEDLLKIEKVAEKHDDKSVIVFSPADEEAIYPKGGYKKMAAGKMGKILEGSLRPDHFDGVLTVVRRLFEMFSPTKAYFGKKDFQQLNLVQKMAHNEKLGVDIVGLPTIRERSGLALSSRNAYLTDEEKSKGLKLQETLRKAGAILKKEGLQEAKDFLMKERKQDAKFNYLEIRDAETLTEPKNFGRPLVILGNYQLGKTRLLDNLEVEPTPEPESNNKEENKEEK